jgi:integrase
MERTKAPGLKWRSRRSGEVPYWIASEAAVKAGYKPQSVRLHYQTEDELKARCHRLQAEMALWLGGQKNSAAPFDGSFGSLLRLYQTDPESSYKRLKASSRHPYQVYLGKLEGHIGDRQIAACDGRDLTRWFAIWSEPNKPGGRRKIAAARMAVCVIKAAMSFGIICRLPGCGEFRAILDRMEFEGTKPRTAAPTAADVEALRRAAHDAGAPSRALAYALQFETTLRLWDVIGEWVALSDPRPSAVLGPAGKWLGAAWSNIDVNMVLRITPEKTSDTSEARVAIDLRECPMVVAELAHVPETKRTGPLIIDPKTGLPYIHRTMRDAWRKDATAAGLLRSVWNRDLRAGGVTEARDAGAPTDDIAKTAGHSDARTTARVYDRAALEAARRVTRARVGHRNEPGT